MPISLFDLQRDRRTVRLANLDLTITYRPNQLTPARELAILRQSSPVEDDADDDEILAVAQRNISRQLESFIELVESWDFLGPLAVDSNGVLLPIPPDQNERAQEYVNEQGGKLIVATGAPVPLTVECLSILPSYFLTDVVQAINEDLRPDPKKRRR